MLRDVRVAHNYFEALFQLRDLSKITALLNKLATSQVREVKQVRDRAIARGLSDARPAATAAGGGHEGVATQKNENGLIPQSWP